MHISVIIPTHNPDEVRLSRTLAGLCAQTLAAENWECILVNNASTRFPDDTFFRKYGPRNFKVIEEVRLGLNFARACGLSQARAHIAVFVDDDNVLAPDYLSHAIELTEQHRNIGLFGGRIRPEFEVTPPPWINEFYGILACWDHGNSPLISSAEAYGPDGILKWPVFAPVGAGMVLRRTAWKDWLHSVESGSTLISDRQGEKLTSGGDNELVLIALKASWQVGYFPSLTLTHLIPTSRLDPSYLARLNFCCSFGHSKVVVSPANCKILDPQQSMVSS